MHSKLTLNGWSKKTAEATGNLVGNKIAEKITKSALKRTKSTAPTHIDEKKPEKSKQFINKLWLLKS